MFRPWSVRRSGGRACRPQKPSRRGVRRRTPGVEVLEDRTVPASTITIVPGAAGSGSLDSFLLQFGGRVSENDGGTNPGTLSTGALTSVAASGDISVSARAGITFNDLGGTLGLATQRGNRVTFDTVGAITF